MRRHLRQARAATLVVLILGLGISPNVVLCVGDNGHRALEFLSEACCHLQDSGGSEWTEPGDRCSPGCKDVRLATDMTLSKWSERDLARAGIVKIPAAVLIPAAPLPGPLAKTIPLRARASIPDSLTPRERRTTVQLC